jgi:methionyl-tRNA formyltransferase
MAELKFLLLCSNRIAIPAIQALAFAGQLTVVGIPSHADELFEEISLMLKDSGIPVIALEKKTFAKKLSGIIQKHSVNTGLMITFSYRLPLELISLPLNGFYNIHPGALPRFRGADPVFQQIRLREKQAGVTLHKADKDFDTGPIILSEMIRLDPTYTYGILNEKLSYIAAKLTGTLSRLLSLEISIPSVAQNESNAVYFQKQGASDIIINWQVMEARSIIALINACNPWNKGAVTKLNGKIIRVLEAEIINNDKPGHLPGTILSIDNNGMTVSCINNESINIHIIYIDEGFLLAARLKEWGIGPGARFSQA